MKKITLFIAIILVLPTSFSCRQQQQKEPDTVIGESPKLMWIDATANIRRFNNKDTIDYYLLKLSSLGFTDVVVDIRPISGHVLYDSDIAPKLKEWQGDTIHYTFDYLGYFISKAHEIDMRVQASMNTFVAGHNYMDRGIIYEQGKSEWASIVYPPSEEKKLIPIMEEKQKYSTMVNPVNEEFQAYILSIFEEVARKYPQLDGIIMDRVRYDGFTADFSDLSRHKFEEYIGKEINKFPDDIYVWKKDQQGNLYPEKGPYFLQWVEWRAQVIYDFISTARDRIKSVNPDLSFGDYTGAWYPTYFEVGVNFASKHYDPSIEYDWASPTYKNTGYAELIDLFTVGNYYTTITKEEYLKNNPEVKNETDMQAQSSLWYCVEGSCENLRTVMGDNKFVGGILADQFYDNPEGLAESIKMNLAKSDGLMIFDIVHIINKDMWDYVEKGMRESGIIL